MEYDQAEADLIAPDLINWYNPSPKSHHSGSNSASREAIASIFMGGLSAGGQASTCEPAVLGAFSESPPVSPRNGGCDDLLWGDLEGLNVIGAQFAAATGGCDDLLWGDLEGLNIIGAQFAAATGGNEPDTAVVTGACCGLDDFEIIGAYDAGAPDDDTPDDSEHDSSDSDASDSDSSDSEHDGDDGRRDGDYDVYDDNDVDGNNDVDANDDDNDDGGAYDGAAEYNGPNNESDSDKHEDPHVPRNVGGRVDNMVPVTADVDPFIVSDSYTGSGADILEDLLRGDLYYAGADDGAVNNGDTSSHAVGLTHQSSSSMRNDWANAALVV